MTAQIIDLSEARGRKALRLADTSPMPALFEAFKNRPIKAAPKWPAPGGEHIDPNASLADLAAEVLAAKQELHRSLDIMSVELNDAARGRMDTALAYLSKRQPATLAEIGVLAEVLDNFNLASGSLGAIAKTLTAAVRRIEGAA